MTRRLRRALVVACAAASVSVGTVPTASATDAVHRGAPSVRGVAPAVLPGTVPAATAVLPANTADASSAPTYYMTRPDLPRFTTTTTQPGTPHPGALVGGYVGATGAGTKSAVAVYGNDGEPIWIKPDVYGGVSPTPFSYGNVYGLAYFVGPDHWEIIGSDNRKFADVPVSSEYPHTGTHFAQYPNSTLAVVSGSRRELIDLTPYGGSGPGSVIVGTVSTVDIQTGAVLFSWSSLAPGAEATGQGPIPITDTYRQPEGRTLDYLGISSVAFGDSPNRILISARGTSAVYEIDTTTGQIVWTLGGKQPTVPLPEGTPAPHDPLSVRAHSDGSVYVGDADPQTGRGRGLVYGTDGAAPTNLIKQLAPATAPVVQPNTRGAFQPVSRAVSGSGTYAGLLSVDGTLFEYDANDALVFTAMPPAPQRIVTTRAPWYGQPATSPDIAAETQAGNHAVVYASWNGSTNVAQWRVQIGPDSDSLRTVATAPRTGFETAIPIDYATGDVHVRVDALDANGARVGTVDQPGLLAIAEAYARAGGAQTLGLPKTRTAYGDSQTFLYEYGKVSWSPRTGAHAVTGKIWEMGRSGSALGLPTADAVALPDGRGTAQDFEQGSAYYTAATGAHAVTRAFRDKYRATGAERGPLGYPTTDEIVGSGPNVASHQRFENGALIPQYAHSETAPIYAVVGAIYQKWIAMGSMQSPLGPPLSDEQTTPDGVGRYVHFGNYWSIYWTPETGAQALDDRILVKWRAEGWERGVLGYPVTSAASTPDGVGWYAHFQGGSVYWSANTDAHIVRGAIRDKWAETGWERGPLGFPTTDELGTPDGVGRYNHFQGGSVYWTPSTWSHVVRGDILATWASLGWERSRLGYPKNDEYTVADGDQRQDFEHGYILWNHVTRQTTVGYF